MAAQANPYYTLRAGDTEPAHATKMLGSVSNAVIIYNPAAGRLRGRTRKLEKARENLRKSGIEADLWGTTGPGAATALARQAVADRRGLVIASGGDGTINEVVNGLAHSRVPLAVLPAGTANVLGKELELPWDVAEAARRIAGASLRRIALGAAVHPGREAAPRYFIALAGVGPDGMMVHATSLSLKKRIGVLAYWLEGVRQAFSYRFPTFRVVSGGKEDVASMLIVGRTKHYGGPVKVTTQASLFEDQFEVMISVSASRARNLLGFPALLAGRHRNLKHVRFWKCTSVRAEPWREDVHAQVDGEYIGTLPVEFRIVPDALTLVVPNKVAGH